MSESYFFNHVEPNTQNSKIIEAFKEFAQKKKKQTYIVVYPITDKKYQKDIDSALIVLIPNHRALFVNISFSQSEFNNFVEDTLDDISSISDKFEYQKILGRVRLWKKRLTTSKSGSELKTTKIEEELQKIKLSSPRDLRDSELLISLFTGSINDVDRIKEDLPTNLLDKIKQKIQLFDGEQTRFIYKKPEDKVIRIQGLSGTGKTELLLHKLRELYINPEEPNSKIFFTCHNRILANNLRERIPSFFNLMKVDKQIEWETRLWCTNAWGSLYEPDQGAYSYICNFYGLPFYNYRDVGDFELACKLSLSKLDDKFIEKVGHPFDYMLIDESQDFKSSFFKLCEKATKKNIFIAGDIFQSIFDVEKDKDLSPHHLLSKCYRTEPKTLMFAHCAGLGVFEVPQISWLKKKEWEACGYIYSEESPTEIKLTREPLRRFEDIDPDIEFIKILGIDECGDFYSEASKKTLEIYQEIKSEYPTFTQNDIGIIVLDKLKYVTQLASGIEQELYDRHGASINRAFETKGKENNQIFLSNQNNVKGLEFPFVIVITPKIKRNFSFRNTMYMALTRSFLKTYFIVSNEKNENLIELYKKQIENIKKKEYLLVKKPQNPEDLLSTRINYQRKREKSFLDLATEQIEKLKIKPDKHNEFINAIKLVTRGEADPKKIEDAAAYIAKTWSD